jgi:hypothetical protein
LTRFTTSEQEEQLVLVLVVSTKLKGGGNYLDIKLVQHEKDMEEQKIPS